MSGFFKSLIKAVGGLVDIVLRRKKKPELKDKVEIYPLW